VGSKEILISIITNKGDCRQIKDCGDCPLSEECENTQGFKGGGRLSAALAMAKEEYGADNLFDLAL